MYGVFQGILSLINVWGESYLTLRCVLLKNTTEQEETQLVSNQKLFYFIFCTGAEATCVKRRVRWRSHTSEKKPGELRLVE